MMKTKAPSDGRVGYKELIDFFQTSANELNKENIKYYHLKKKYK